MPGDTQRQVVEDTTQCYQNLSYVHFEVILSFCRPKTTNVFDELEDKFSPRQIELIIYKSIRVGM